MINWKISKQDDQLVTQIIARAAKAGLLRETDTLPARMDIECVHADDDGPLRLADLLAADDFNFANDIRGIQKYLDRSTGKLTDCFSPRFTAPKKAAKP